MAERRLGRGLDFLISRTTPVPPPVPRPAVVEALAAAAASPPPAAPPPPPAPPPGPRHIALASIAPNPFQPRVEFEPEALADLEASIRTHGVLQPVVVRPSGDGFQLVAGERRFRASRNLGLADIPAVVREVSDSQMLALALVENLQRESLNPIETARAYRQLLETPDLTQEDVARAVGKSRVSIANTVRLLDLPADLQEHVSRGTLSAGHGRALLMVADEGERRALGARILAEGLSVREAEALAAGGGAGVPATALRTVRPAKERSSHLGELEDRLRTSLGTRVAIKPGRGKRGKIVLHYANLEEFDRLYEILTGPAEPKANRNAG
jgi:ParB family chromosome partitioning protein